MSNPYVISRSHESHEACRLCFAILFLVLAAFSNLAALAYIHDFVGREALPDVVFAVIPEQTWALKVGDGMVMLCVIFLITLVVCHRERVVILRRTFFIFACLYSMRTVSLLCTQLPSGYVDNDSQCRAKLNQSIISWDLFALRILEQAYKFGFQDVNAKMLCGDLLFSGHTISMVTSALTISYYLPDSIRPLRWVGCSGNSASSCGNSAKAECRERTAERFMVKQLFFHNGDPTQSLGSSSDPSNDLAVKLERAEIESNLLRENYSKAQAEVQKSAKAKERYKALYEREREKTKRQELQLKTTQVLEMMLQDQQLLQKKIEQYESRLKASALYKTLTGTTPEANVLELIDDLIGDNAQPDAAKFLDILRRELHKTKRNLKKVEAQWDVTKKKVIDLNMKLNSHQALNVALRDEVLALCGNNMNEKLNDSRLQPVLMYSPDRRVSYGFALNESKEFPESLIASAYRARNQPSCSKNPFKKLNDSQNRDQQNQNKDKRFMAFLFDDSPQPSTSKVDDCRVEDERDTPKQRGNEKENVENISSPKVPNDVMKRVLLSLEAEQKGTRRKLPFSSENTHIKRIKSASSIQTNPHRPTDTNRPKSMLTSKPPQARITSFFRQPQSNPNQNSHQLPSISSNAVTKKSSSAADHNDTILIDSD
ncbi:unnamed protein product [Anisakis simplex]|uniref:PAP2_C domain-containing protein n=1 Tax=Anisakis simplex TaxID=6269 RepID=A0A0M3K229_ANISI|nr:unnamed protein product [Anisakis simplex]